MREILVYAEYNKNDEQIGKEVIVYKKDGIIKNEASVGPNFRIVRYRYSGYKKNYIKFISSRVRSVHEILEEIEIGKQQEKQELIESGVEPKKRGREAKYSKEDIEEIVTKANNNKVPLLEYLRSTGNAAEYPTIYQNIKKYNLVIETKGKRGRAKK